MKKGFIMAGILVFTVFLVVFAATTIEDFFLPGSQVGQSGNLETPDKCDNCHGGYDVNVEPAFNWRGSMMSQAARDPLFYACLAIANQDAPDVGDMCLRCHTPDGWLNGRCVPTDGSALNNNDRQGVQCDFCHKMVKPTSLGVNPFPGDQQYLSLAYGSGTYTQDQAYLAFIITMPGNSIPITSSSAMYIADANNAKRGPYTDATGRHQMFYSPFHRESEHCGTCHDVSNPAFTRASTSEPNYIYNTENTPAPVFDPKLMFPVERTYGEWKASGYANTSSGYFKTCQDCHMRDVTGKGAKLKDAKVRTDLGLHDMTGGNTFVPNLVKQLYPAEVNPQALDAGVVRARNTLKSAATLNLNVDENTGIATVTVTNNTGHKLPTGYPEGRRMWLNVKFYDATNNFIAQSGAYDPATAVLTKEGTKIYECEPGNDQGPSFHFAINNKIWHDNRIPPRGFTNAALIANQSPVVDYTYPDGQYWDITSYTLPAGTAKVEANLLYQTTSKEYVEFLRDANVTNTKGQELYDLWVAHGKGAPELMASKVWPVPIQLEAQILSITRTTNKQGIAYATATVMITCGGTPIPNANVTAGFTGPTNGTVNGTTGTNGTVKLNSTTKKSPVGEWCFTVTAATASGYTALKPPYPTACESTFKSSPAIEQDEYVTDLLVYPNPASTTATLEYSLQEDAQVNITLFNTSGKQVAEMVNRHMEKGVYKSHFNVSALQQGIYIVRMQTGGTTITQKIVVTK